MDFRIPIKRCVLVIIIATIFLLIPFLCSRIDFAANVSAAEPLMPDWTRTARIGGAAVWVDMTSAELNQIVDTLLAQNVSVIEADSDLSNYMTDAQFQQELALMRDLVAVAHGKGLKIVWYYPSLEVLTPKARTAAHTMYKDHPDWVQRGLGGVANVFIGGGGQVFWVDPGMESAWMSPSSPYREYFKDRVKLIAATGLDGLWADVPIYSDFGSVKWADFNAYAVAKFKTDTGLIAPTAENWNDATWRRWVAWRHEELAAFLRDVTAAARSVNPGFAVIAETLPTDYNGGTVYGLYGADFKAAEGLTSVWEVDTLSNNTGMRKAKEDDWISYLGAHKFARAAMGSKPSWTFTYGLQENDAELVMAEALAAGNNPYELKIPEMTSTVGDAYRKRMFGWMKQNSELLYSARTGARVAVYFSYPSRDYVDKAAGLGMFATWQSNDDLWWASDAIDSAYQRQYLAEHRGMLKLLVHNHIPFDIVIKPDLAELSQYEAVILPDVEAIPDSEAELFRNYVQNGGNLLLTGPNPTGLDEFGTARGDYALADLLGFHKGAAVPAEKQSILGSGKVRFHSALLGKSYFVSSDANAQATLLGSLRQIHANALSTNADRRVHMEMKQLGDKTILHFVNFVGVNGSFALIPTSFTVSLTVPAGKQVTLVELTSPDNATPTLAPVNYTIIDQAVSFDLLVDKYAVAVISMTDGGTPTTTVTTTLPPTTVPTTTLPPPTTLPPTTVPTTTLPPPTTLPPTTVPTTTLPPPTTVPTTTMPPPTTLPPTTLPPTTVPTTTLPPPTTLPLPATTTTTLPTGSISPAPYFPKAVKVTLGYYDEGNLASLRAADFNTYDVLSKPADGGQVTDWYAATTLIGSPTALAGLTVTYKGHYSASSVIQDLFLYNFKTSSWEKLDTRTVGSQNNVTVQLIISTDPQRFVSANGEMRARIRGFKVVNEMFCWGDYLSWSVR